MNENYSRIDIIDLGQLQSGGILLGKITFQHLLSIHRLTERKETKFDPYSENSSSGKTVDDGEFQRKLSKAKLNKISKFLAKEFEFHRQGKSICIFPTSLLLSLQLHPDARVVNIDEEQLSEAYVSDPKKSLLDLNHKNLFIPHEDEICLIVDGQHRLLGMKKFINSLDDKETIDLVNNFEFAATFLVNFDIYQLGKIFATVNFEQKPVNRSLYFDIFGSLPFTDRNDIKLAHDLALHLNNNKSSPINGMIKQLGKGTGLFSQSFFVLKMLLHFREGGVWEGLFTDYKLGGKKYKILSPFMNAYLTSLQRSYSIAWPRKSEIDGELVYSARNYDFILCKTTGMGAFLRLIENIYPLVQGYSEENWNAKISEILTKIPSSEVESILHTEGDFKGTGEGVQLQLYRHLCIKLGLT